MSYQYFHETTLRNDDLIVTSLKNVVFGSMSEKKKDLQYFGHNFDRFKLYSFNFFARNIVKNAKQLTQQKSEVRLT